MARTPATRKLAVAAAAAAALAASWNHAAAGTAAAGTAAAPGRAAAQAIAYARNQIGKPYQWGGTGPDTFDCSGLVMMAYRAAGISIARRSQDQWATEPHIPASQAGPGDLVFFAGADGTSTAPGHVGLVTGPHTMIEAYATGYPVRVSPFGTPGAAPGDQYPVGYTRPWPRAGRP
jgi:cell wall-associated NlpC family hydrolase